MRSTTISNFNHSNWLTQSTKSDTTPSLDRLNQTRSLSVKYFFFKLHYKTRQPRANIHCICARHKVDQFDWWSSLAYSLTRLLLLTLSFFDQNVFFFFFSCITFLFWAVKRPMFFCYFIVILSTGRVVFFILYERHKLNRQPSIISFIKWQMYLICAIKDRLNR